MDKILTEKNRLKKTGIEISKYGFGAWGIGGIHYGAVNKDVGKQVILSYINAGGNYIDTARGYGDSEAILGETLEENNLLDKVVISTKTKGGEFRDTVDHIREDLEVSLKDLRRDYVDILFLHWPPEQSEVLDLSLGVCEKLREEGLIRAIGVSLKGPDVFQSTSDLARMYIKDGRIDCMMMVYSILRQMNQQVFKEAYDNGIGVIARTSLESGFLVAGAIKKGTRFEEIDHRSRWNTKVDMIVETAAEIATRTVKPPYEGLNEVAIRFSSAAEGVTSVIIGALEPAHMEANLKAVSRPPLDPEVLSYLRHTYKDFTDKFNSGQGTKVFVRPDGIK